MQENIVKHSYKVSKETRNTNNGHNSFFILLTGLSGSGKSTIANALEYLLTQKGLKTYVLDGDNIRSGINANLTFSAEDRTENIRRIAEIGKLMVDAGLITLAAFIAPFKKDRENIANTINPINFVEIYVNTSLEECEKRDVKGLYKRARAGEIKFMTGIDSPYEVPEHPDVVVGENMEMQECIEKILTVINKKIELRK